MGVEHVASGERDPVALPDGTVRIIASKELYEAELRSEVDRLSVWQSPEPFAVRTRYYVTCEMRSYVIISAPDYASAFTHLFTQWSPTVDRLELLPPDTHARHADLTEPLREISGRYGTDTPPELLP